MRQEDLLNIATSADQDTLLSALVSVAGSLGFERVGAFLAIDRPSGRPFFQMIDNTPDEFRAKSRDPADILRDPVLIHLRRSNLPIAYDRTTYMAAGAADLWEEQAQYGFKTGVALALHLPQGQHVVVGIDREHELPEDGEELTRILGAVHLMATYSIEAVSRTLGVVTPELPPGKHLTNRECDVLQWTSLGKSSWAISSILGLSEHTVNFHLRNAMRKLGCSSKHVAAIRALNLGLIRP